jgi:hypothetical protein
VFQSKGTVYHVKVCYLPPPPKSNFSKVSTPSVSSQRQGVGTRTLKSIEQLVDQFIVLNRRQTNRPASFIADELKTIFEQKILIEDCIDSLIRFFDGLTPEQAQSRLNGLEENDPRIPLLTEMSKPGFNIETLKNGYCELFSRLSELELQLLREQNQILPTAH